MKRSTSILLAVGIVASSSFAFHVASASGDTVDTSCWDQYNLKGSTLVGTLVPTGISQGDCTPAVGCWYGYRASDGRRNSWYVPHGLSPRTACASTSTAAAPTTVAPSTVATTVARRLLRRLRRRLPRRLRRRLLSTVATTVASTVATTVAPDGCDDGCSLDGCDDGCSLDGCSHYDGSADDAPTDRSVRRDVYRQCGPRPLQHGHLSP